MTYHINLQLLFDYLETPRDVLLFVAAPTDSLPLTTPMDILDEILFLLVFRLDSETGAKLTRLKLMAFL